ncbi:MAG: hypothetical protein DRP02_04435 [Candidatus Gerdarchaeota archaeon]|nr:MAG: hypothetical protein DRO63_02710 [Candidatus Gerdarchaeota archaeon]RLI71529.1 MAG: hypothetical protein DRP02_04435 [Candidatus Gerdarchaeota archaeon]
MKPTNLCLTSIGKSGLELVTVVPDTIPNIILNEIVLKSMPLSAKAGDFASSTVEGYQIECFIFSVPSDERQNIASLVAIYDNPNYDRDTVRKFFSTIMELQRYNMSDTNTFSKILSSMLEGLKKGKVKIKISSVVTLEFNFDDDSKKKKKDRGEEFLESVKDDIWR